MLVVDVMLCNMLCVGQEQEKLRWVFWLWMLCWVICLFRTGTVTVAVNVFCGCYVV